DVCSSDLAWRGLQPRRRTREQHLDAGSDRAHRADERQEIEVAVCRRGPEGRSHLLHLELRKIQMGLSQLENHARAGHDSRRDYRVAAGAVEVDNWCGKQVQARLAHVLHHRKTLPWTRWDHRSEMR